MNNFIKGISITLFLILVLSISGCMEPQVVTPTKSPSLNSTGVDLLYSAFDFENLSELQQWFTSEESMMEEVFTEDFNTLIKAINDKEKVIKAPYIDNKLVGFRNDKDLSNITLFQKELYNRPWLWYYCTINGVEYRIMLMYLSDEEINYAKQHSASEIIEYIWPGAPNVFNKNEYDNYSNIYESELVLKNRTVSVLCSEAIKHERTYKAFVYDDLLVKVMAKTEKFNDTDLLGLEFK